MNEYLPVFSKSKLFNGLSDQEIISVISCLNGRIKSYNKDQIIFFAERTTENIGIVILGAVKTQRIDDFGNANIISLLPPGSIFGATAYFSTSKTMPNDVIASSDCVVLLLEGKQLVSTCCKACHFHQLIITNLLNVISDRNKELAQKIEILSYRNIREKVLAYLSSFKQSEIIINLDRQQLADYLFVDRSALSRELSKMKQEGLIDYKGKWFKKER